MPSSPPNMTGAQFALVRRRPGGRRYIRAPGGTHGCSSGCSSAPCRIVHGGPIKQQPATAHNARTIRANWGYVRPEKQTVMRQRRATEHLTHTPGSGWVTRFRWSWLGLSVLSRAVSAGSNPAMPPPLLGNLGGVRFRERNGSGQPRACVARCGQFDRAQCTDQLI